MMTLYSVDSANGHKAQIALEEAGLAYKLRAVNLEAGEHRTEAYRALNPFGKAPVLHDPEGPDGAPIALGETLAICRYALEKGGGAGLATDARGRAEEAMWSAAVASSVAMPFAMQFFATRLAPTPDPWLVETMTSGCHAALQVFETRLCDRPYVMGAAFGLVDCLFWPVVATSAARLEGGLDRYPNLIAYRERVGARPAVRRAMARRPA